MHFSIGSRDKLGAKARRNLGSLRIDGVVRLAETADRTGTRTTGGHDVVSHTKTIYAQPEALAADADCLNFIWGIRRGVP